MRTSIALCLAFAALSLLPAVSLAQSGSSAVITDATFSPSSSSEAAASPGLPAAPAPSAGPSERTSGVGLGIKLSSLGPGAEVAVALSRRSNVRGGVNAIMYSRGYDNSGIHYQGDLKWISAEAHYDWFPFANAFHISPGVLAYNDNHVTATASATGGALFNLNGTHYISDPSNPVTGSAKLYFNKAAPSLMLGFGNLVPRGKRHFSVNIEAGVAFQGSPKIALNLTGNVCDPTGTNCRNIGTDTTVQNNVRGQQTKISNDLSPFKYYPLLSLTLGYRF